VAKYDATACKVLFSLSKRTRSALIPLKLGVRCPNEIRNMSSMANEFSFDGAKESFDRLWRRTVHKYVQGSQWQRRLFKQSITYDIPAKYSQSRLIGFHKSQDFDGQDSIGFYLLNAKSRVDGNISTIDEEAKILQDMILTYNDDNGRSNCCVAILQREISGRSAIDIALVSSANDDPSRVYNMMYFLLECGKGKPSKNTSVPAAYRKDDVNIDKLISYYELLSPQEPLRITDPYIVSLIDDRPGEWRYTKVLFDEIVLLDHEWIVIPYSNDNDKFMISLWKIINNKKVEFIGSRFINTDCGPLAKFTITKQNLDIIFVGSYQSGRHIRSTLWTPNSLTSKPCDTEVGEDTSMFTPDISVPEKCLLGTVGQGISNWAHLTPISYQKLSGDIHVPQVLEKALYKYLYDNDLISLNRLTPIKESLEKLFNSISSSDYSGTPVIPEFVLPIDLTSTPSEQRLQLMATRDGLFVLTDERGEIETIALGFIPEGIDEIVTSDGLIIFRSGARIYSIFLPNSINYLPNSHPILLNDLHRSKLEGGTTTRNEVTEGHQALLRIHDIIDDSNGDRKFFFAIEENEMDCNPTLIEMFSLKIKPTNMKLVPLVNDAKLFYRLLVFYRMDIRHLDISTKWDGSATTTKTRSRHGKGRRVIKIERGMIQFKSREDVKNDEIKHFCLSVPYLIASYRSKCIAVWDIAKKSLIFQFRANEMQPRSLNQRLGCIFRLDEGICSILSNLFNRYYRYIEASPTSVKLKDEVTVKDDEYGPTSCTANSSTVSSSVAPSLTKLSLLVYDTPDIHKELHTKDLSILNEIINQLWELHAFYILSGDRMMRSPDDLKEIDPESIQDFPSLGDLAGATNVTVAASQWSSKAIFHPSVTEKSDQNTDADPAKNGRAMLLKKLEDLVDSFPILDYPYLMHQLVLALSQATALGQQYADLGPVNEIKVLLDDNGDIELEGNGINNTSNFNKELGDIIGPKWNYLRGDARGLLMGDEAWRRKDHDTMEFSDHIYDASSEMESSEVSYRSKKGSLIVMIDPDVGFVTFDSKHRILHLEFI